MVFLPASALMGIPAMFGAKHYGDDIANYYRTGGGSVIDEDPRDFQALNVDSETHVDWWDMTLVFCVYPLELSDTGEWYVFGAESGNIIIGHWDSDGGIWVGARDNPSNTTKSANTVGDGAGDYAGMKINAWNSIMIAIQTTGGQRKIKMRSNGIEEYNGVLGSGDNAIHPHSYSGYVWAGRGDGFSGSPERGMECYVSSIWCDDQYLDPDTYYTDFFDEEFKPKNIGADGSGVTATVPETYAPNGDLTNNAGTGKDWDEIGTVPNAPITPW